MGIGGSCCIEEASATVVKEEVCVARSKRYALRLPGGPHWMKARDITAPAIAAHPSASSLGSACWCEDEAPEGALEELQLWRTQCAAPGFSAEDPIIVVHPPLAALEKLIQLESLEVNGPMCSWGSSRLWPNEFKECTTFSLSMREARHTDFENLECQLPEEQVEDSGGTSTKLAAGTTISMCSKLRGPCARMQGCHAPKQCQEFHLAAALCSVRGALLVFLLVLYISVQQVLSSLALFPGASMRDTEGISVPLGASANGSSAIAAARFASTTFYELCASAGFALVALLAHAATPPGKVEKVGETLSAPPVEFPVGASTVKLPPPLPPMSPGSKKAEGRSSVATLAAAALALGQQQPEDEVPDVEPPPEEPLPCRPAAPGESASTRLPVSAEDEVPDVEPPPEEPLPSRPAAPGESASTRLPVSAEEKLWICHESLSAAVGQLSAPVQQPMAHSQSPVMPEPDDPLPLPSTWLSADVTPCSRLEGTGSSSSAPFTIGAITDKIDVRTETGDRSHRAETQTFISVAAVTVFCVGLRIAYSLCSSAATVDTVAPTAPEPGSWLMALGVADALAAGFGPLLVVFFVVLRRPLQQRCMPLSAAVLVMGTALLQIVVGMVPVLFDQCKANLYKSPWTVLIVTGAAAVIAAAAATEEVAFGLRLGVAACWAFVWGSCTVFLARYFIVFIAPLMAAKKLLLAQGALHALVATWAMFSSPMVSLMGQAGCKDPPVHCYFILHVLLGIYSRLVFTKASFPSIEFALLLVLTCCSEFAQVSGLLTFGRACVFQRCHRSGRSKEMQSKSDLAQSNTDVLQAVSGTKDVADEKIAVKRRFSWTWWVWRSEIEAWMQGFASLIADIAAMAVVVSENLLEVFHGKCLPEDCTHSDVGPPLTQTSAQIMRRWLLAALGTLLVASRFTQWLAGQCRRQGAQRFVGADPDEAEGRIEFDAKHFFRQNYVWFIVCVAVVVVPAIGRAQMELQAMRHIDSQ